MRIIIGGAGRVGTELAQALRNESKDVVLMDHDARAVKSAQGLDVLVIQGDVTHRPKFIEAGIEDAQVYIAAGVTDMRKSINGLSILLADQLDLDPLSVTVNRYIFTVTNLMVTANKASVR